MLVPEEDKKTPDPPLNPSGFNGVHPAWQDRATAFAVSEYGRWIRLLPTL